MARMSVRKPTLHEIMAALVILWLNSGMFLIIQRFIPGIVMYGVFGLWLLSAFNKKGFQNSFKKLLIGVMVPFLFVLFMYLYNKDGLTRNYVMLLVYGFILLCMGEYYKENSKSKQFLMKVWIVDSAVIIINTLIQLQTNPLIVRQMSIGGLEENRMACVASFSHVLCYAFAVLFLFERLCRKNTEKKTTSIIALIAMLLLVIQSQIVLLIAATLMGIIILLAMRPLGNKRARITYLAIAVVVLGCVYIALPTILSMLSTWSVLPEVVRVKLEDVRILLNTGTAALVDNAGQRIENYEMSIGQFKSNILFGSMGVSDEIGAHATWLDLLGMYGLCAIPYGWWMVSIVHRNIKSADSNDRKIIILISGIYLAVGFLDPILFQNTFVFFAVIMPFLTIRQPLANINMSKQSEC